MAEKKAPRDHRQEMTDKLIEQLEAGTAPWQKPWTDGVGHRPHNPTTGKPYRGGNAMWLDMQGYSDPRWMTYKQASEAGYQVRKGEKSTLVEYWKFHDEKKEQGPDGQEKTVRMTLERPRVFSAFVFNAQQIDGIPPIEKKEHAWDANEKAEKILAASGARIHNDQAGRAFYRPSTDSIHLPERSQFETEGHYYATALHELGHWSGHESRLNRQLDGGFGSESYAREELRAEIASYFLGTELGIPHDPSNHAAYVGSWIKALKEDKNEIFRAARDAEQIADFVMGFAPELKAEKAPATLQKNEARGEPAPAQENAPEAPAGRSLRDAIAGLESKPRPDFRALGKKAGQEADQHMRDEMSM